MMLEEILNFIKHNTPCDDYEYIGAWNNFEVYNPIYSDGIERDEGITPFVLVKGCEIRLSEIPNETFRIMAYFG